MLAIDPSNAALFLDIDGTLIEIRDAPDEVIASNELLVTMERLLHAFSGAVAIVSGRRIRDIDRIFAPLKLAAAGVHGIQLRTKQNGEVVTTAPKLPAELVTAVDRKLSALQGITIEQKDEAVAVHYRRAPWHRAKIEDELKILVEAYGRQLEISKGRMVFEIVPISCSKGKALKRIAEIAPFAGRRPIMIGDDHPDVSAMQTAKEENGFGWTVGGEFFAPDTADFGGPADVRAWLKTLVVSETP